MLQSLLSSLGLHSPWMLLGLFALAIPPIIHLLNRRRYQVVDWGAMQFLQVSEVTRRRLMLEEVLLMLLRIGLLGLLVFGLAGPFLSGSVASKLAGRPSRDVVIIVDGSASMTAIDETGTRSPLVTARDWTLAFLDGLAPGDGVAVLLAREQPVPIVGDFSADLKTVRERVKNLPTPAGSCNWQEALRRAHALLADSQRNEREIVLLGDGQKFGWADSDNLFRWELLANELGYNHPEAAAGQPRPRIWAVNVGLEKPQDGTKPGESSPPPNWSLTPLRSNRPVVPVDREVGFQTDILLQGQKNYTPPYKIRLEIDGKPVRDLAPPRDAKLEDVAQSGGKVPFSFQHRFGTPGSHLVSLILEADPPKEEQPRGYALKDRVPGDNRQDFSVEVVASLPVLLVDGDPSLTPPPHRGTDFLRDALSPARDRTPVVQARVVSINDFTPSLLTGDQRPRVVVLANVPKLTPVQQESMSQFLAEGGGVLVALGSRVEAEQYNEALYRGGEGWLPARLDGIEGDERRPRDAARPDPATFTHPALELFRRLTVGGLGEARFLRWWKVTTPGKHAPGVTAGLLRSPTAAYPFIVERSYQAGRVLLSATPLDNGFGSNLPDLPAFVPLAHELIYYLAGARSSEFNLQPGQPIRYRLDTETPLESIHLQPPSGEERPLGNRPGDKSSYLAQLLPQERGSLVVFDGTREPGVWRLKTADNATIYYAVQPDPREADLSPSTEEDRAKVAQIIPVKYESEVGEMAKAGPGGEVRQDLWLYLLLGLIALLCGEVWMTRRMVMNR